MRLVTWEFLLAFQDGAALTGAVMLAAFIACALGVVIDPRTVTGVPAWLKPAKFAISSAIFTGTIAWLFHYITRA